MGATQDAVFVVVIGLGWNPLILLAPYGLGALLGWSDKTQGMGFPLFMNFLTLCALNHIAKQHWGFAALYRRKNDDAQNADIDRRFFLATLWLPYLAMICAPWYMDFDGTPVWGTQIAIAGTTSGRVLHLSFHLIFWLLVLSYGVYQVLQWKRGGTLNGPKLAYMGTILAIYYVTFSIHPLIAAFWVVLTGTGHCAQYHRVVWNYGKNKYANKQGKERRPSSKIFENVWLYMLLGVGFALLTLRGPGGGAAQRLIGGWIGGVFTFLSASAGVALGVKLMYTLVMGVRLHHFYVDGKIWKINKHKTVATALNL
ncbi:MAG: hypothetical protein R3C68_00135 [Myxococcota bacterium]